VGIVNRRRSFGVEFTYQMYARVIHTADALKLRGNSLKPVFLWLDLRRFTFLHRRVDLQFG
jgi:hypothetical protein